MTQEGRALLSSLSSSAESHAVLASLHVWAPGALSPPHLGLMPPHHRDQLPPLARVAGPGSSLA